LGEQKLVIRFHKALKIYFMQDQKPLKIQLFTSQWLLKELGRRLNQGEIKVSKRLEMDIRQVLQKTIKEVRKSQESGFDW